MNMVDLKPYMLCVFSCFCFAGYNIICKVSLNNGMSIYVFVVYANVFGTLTTAFLALLFERNNHSKISALVLRDVFFLGLLGAMLARIMFLAGLEFTSSNFASAIANIIPSTTFILAVLCRMEKVDISTRSSKAKIGGTLVAFAGAILMTLYKGIVVISFHNPKSTDTTTSKLFLDKDWIKGSVMLLISFISYSGFYILQTSTIKKYPAPLALTSLTCLVGTVLALILAAILDHKASSWRLSWDITLLAPLYCGVVIFGITVYSQTLVIQQKGPVFFTAARPLSTVIVAIMGLLILRESLYLGSVVGTILIVVGIYAIAWEKQEEMQKKTEVQHTISDQCIEIKPEK